MQPDNTIIIRPRRPYYVSMWSIITDQVVCFDILVSPAKTAKPIEMPFGLSTRVGPGNHALDWGPNPHWTGQI